MTAPETIYLDGDASTDEGVYPRCFGDPKPASEPVNVYHHESICILRNDPVLRRVVEAASSAVESWDWWNADQYDRCQSVPQDAIESLRYALSAMQELIGGTNGQTD